MITTKNDLSLDYFVSAAAKYGIQITTLFYKSGEEAISKALYEHMYQFIYFRDPFNEDNYDEVQIRAVVDRIVERYPGAQYIDRAWTFDDLMIEDKWRQYELLSEYMPPTTLLSNEEDFAEGIHIAKERIMTSGRSSVMAKERRSSRAKGVFFRSVDLDETKHYIIQKRLTIVKEYRVYGIHGVILELAGIRSSKSSTTTVKTIAVEPLPSDLLLFAEGVYRKLPSLQFVGFDIAVTDSGSLVLLEVNRSCQFVGYNKKSGSNLADEFLKGLINEK